MKKLLTLLLLPLLLGLSGCGQAAKLSDAEKADKSAGETFKTNILFAGSMLLAAVIIFALALISST